jgi:hypothetical protein
MKGHSGHKPGKKLSRYFLIAVALSLAVVLIFKLSGPSLLQLYIKSGIGSCEEIPILCMTPHEDINTSGLTPQLADSFLPYEFEKMEIRIPKGFCVIQETVKKVYYKRKSRQEKVPTVYLLYKPPDFFIGLFPQLRKYGIADNYNFIRHTMYASLPGVQNIIDTFFVIMKGIFIPDLGDQRNVKMARFSLGSRKGFINYNLSGEEQFFDCNVIDAKDGFFKIYIKDIRGKLDLDSVLAMISTARSRE